MSAEPDSPPTVYSRESFKLIAGVAKAKANVSSLEWRIQIEWTNRESDGDRAFLAFLAEDIGECNVFE